METTLLTVEQVSKTFVSGAASVAAVRSVSFSVAEGEFFGVVGESGSGKSTLLRLIVGSETCDSGCIRLDGRDITQLSPAQRRPLYQDMQMVFQSPADSFDPRLTLRRSLYEPLRNFRRLRDPHELEQSALGLLHTVGLSADLLDRRARELSGGQCQRAAIARAISVSPRLLLCDEITSALDVSAQANIVALLARLSRILRLGVVFVSHDIALVSNICQRCLVMRDGAAVESGPTQQLIDAPQHEYTRRLVEAARLQI